MKPPIVKDDAVCAVQRKMGRPTLEAASALKENLLERALHVLCLHGIDGFSMDLLADEAGVTKRTIYRHFESKMGMVEAVIERQLSRLEAAMEPSGGTQSDPLLALRDWARHFFMHTFDTGMRRFAIFLSFHQLTDPEIAAKSRQWTIRAMAMPSMLIGHAQAGGYVRSGDPHMFALLLMDLLQGSTIRMNFNYPAELIWGGLDREQFFALRWAAFVSLAGCDLWADAVATGRDTTPVCEASGLLTRVSTAS